ncbi:MAG TPA: CHASE2 domain-containing protein [Thioploca sp.]|nr:CHASE2 domain-containing protein [Thioploca sp.]
MQANSLLIIVDIDISQSQSMKNPSPDDQVLAEYLKNHATKCKQNQSDCSPIILVRAFSDESQSILQPRIGFFEDVVTQSFPYIQWGSAEFYVSSTDITRRWSLWEPTCSKEQQPKVISSMALLTMGMIRSCTEEIPNALRSLQLENCRQFLPPESITFCGLTISTKIDSVQQRIMYRMPYSEVPPNKRVVHDNKGVPILTILSAQPYAESPPQDSLEVFPDNSVVVIGGSYGPPSTGVSDMHDTPIGEMPGALVIINAIHSLLQGLTIKPVSYWWLVIAFLIILTLFAAIPEQHNNRRDKTVRWRLIILILFIIAGLFVYSYILFEDGTWLDIAVPVAIIEICRRIYQRKWLKNFANKVIGTPT